MRVHACVCECVRFVRWVKLSVTFRAKELVMVLCECVRCACMKPYEVVCV